MASSDSWGGEHWLTLPSWKASYSQQSCGGPHHHTHAPGVPGCCPETGMVASVAGLLLQDLVTLSNLRKDIQVQTEGWPCSAHFACSRTGARLGELVAGRKQDPPRARQLGHPPGGGAGWGAKFWRGSGGPERSRKILAFQTLKEQFSVPMNFQNFPQPLFGSSHALFCTFSFGSGVVVVGG